MYPNRYNSDGRIVLTLDAGGTNLVFSAIQSNTEISESITIPSEPQNLDTCIGAIMEGFHSLKKELDEDPAAISFAFPGPADYAQGIIGDLPNLPAFRGGVPLASILEKEFKIPVYIQNDGNLFTYGEAMSGFLPFINSALSDAGLSKRYSNLIGVTLGTGFGGGIVVDGHLLTGDNSNAGEVWVMRNRLFPDYNAERTIGVSAIVNRYQYLSADQSIGSPKEVFDVAEGLIPGDDEAAKKVFIELGIVLGDSLATLINTIDGCVVIGGGVAASHKLFVDSMMTELNSAFKNSDRMVARAFNVEDARQFESFKNIETKHLTADQGHLEYAPTPQVAVGLTKLGTSNAIALGAYAYSLNRLEEKK